MGAGSPQAKKKLPRKECSATSGLNKSRDNWIKVLLSRAPPTRARPSFFHHKSLPSGSLHKPLSLLHQRGQTEEAERNTVPQQLKWKPQYRKLISMKKQKFMSQMKGQGKTPEEQLNEVEICNLPETEFRIKIVKMIQDPGKRLEAKIEKMLEMLTKDLEEVKNKQRLIIH